MNPQQQIIIRAPVNAVFLAASDLARWPEFMPHYRYNRYVAQKPSGGTVRTACSLGGFVAKWVAEFTIDTALHTLHFRHTSSSFNATNGLEETWTFIETADGSVEVTISHVLPPRAHMLGAAADWMVRISLVQKIAAQSLGSLKLRVEMQHPARQSREVTILA